MERSYRNCQSCWMPLKKDPSGGGTNADGSRSTKFCSHCFIDGRFTWPDATADQMRALVKDKLREFGFPSFMTGFSTRGIPKLERWRD